MSAIDVAPQRGPDLGEGNSPLNPSDRAFWIGLSVVLLSLVSAFATYLILTGLTPIAPRGEVVFIVLLINVVLILAMIALLAWQVVGLARAWRERIPGARLHIRIVALFSVIAALPALLLAVGATVTFSRSLDSWFSTRTRAIVSSSRDVANAYLDEHGQVIRTDIVNMARDLDAAAGSIGSDAAKLQRLVMVQAGLRDLPAAYVIDLDGRPVVEATVDNRLTFVSPPAAAIRQAEAGQVPLLMPSVNRYRVGAIAKLEKYPGKLLYVARGVSPTVINHLQLTAQNVDEFNRLRKARGGLKVAHGLMYLMISMTALLAAIWVGLWFAGRFVAPIRRLIAAAQEVSKGNLMVTLPEKRGEGDLRRLSKTFNTMTRELKHQRDALVTANEQLLERRHFMEAVLSGVSAGVIGLDSQDRVTLVSRAAGSLLGLVEGDLVGKKLKDAIPLFGAIVERDEHTLKGRSLEEVTFTVGGEERTFAVMVTRERASGGDVGSVVTFDDVTDLVVAQRTAAWADVARRIAHEIKNPLTPIQLSAERLRKKYASSITKDRETFDRLTTTIERQVSDLKAMVDEFAEFARMPKPEMARHDLRQAVQEPVVLFREGHPEIQYDLKLPEKPIYMSFDRRLMTRAVTNLVKNASEAIEAAKEAKSKVNGWKGRIETIVTPQSDRVTIEVIDNGVGLPKHNRNRLLEPYVTTKGHKGTGLGLAMVQKITEQHGGTLALEDAPEAPGRTHGALVRITLPLESGRARVHPEPSQSSTQQLPAQQA
ncbi:MAG TPA: PAS domain-containing sensor histidine kinase [Hyphomicrobium sp.]|jgi:two-component system nitrogen regulation sensor histidine kinase NtrY